jgi:thioredoxin 1
MIVLKDFWATWCPPCKQMNPIIEDLMSEGYNVEKIDVDEKPEIQEKYGVMSIPTYVFEKDGKEFARVSGAMSKDKLVSWFK